MKTREDFPETLDDAIKYFSNDDNALAFMSAVRWPDGVRHCPKCNGTDAVFMPKRRVWRCRSCQKQFSVKMGTIFEESPLGLNKWLPAMWMILNAKNGISSCELARALGVTQKTSWFMLHRIRLAMRNQSIERLTGEVEVDETYVGGAKYKMNKKQRIGSYSGTDTLIGTVVFATVYPWPKAHSQCRQTSSDSAPLFKPLSPSQRARSTSAKPSTRSIEKP
jgi:transposase-like protein